MFRHLAPLSSTVGDSQGAKVEHGIGRRAIVGD